MTAVLDEDRAEPTARRRRRWPRRVLLAGLAALLLLVLYVGGTFVQVWMASRQDDARPAQAIIVLGAAQYNGRPSNVLAARLDHALDLYHRGLAPLIVVTGGGQAGDRFTEAEAAAGYLQDRGVPGSAIERETTSTNSYDELAAASRFLRDQGVTHVLLVSDPFHSFRIDDIASQVGLDAAVSPTHTSPVAGLSELTAMGRETLAVAVGRITGYDRADRIENKLSGP